MKKETLDGNDIKRLCSGGDPLTARVHGGLETSFVPHCLITVFANDLPKIEPYDEAVCIRSNVVSYNKCFVDVVKNKEYELKRDDKLEEETKTLPFRRALINLFIITYNTYINNLKNNIKPLIPKAVLLAKESWIAQDPNYINTFLDEYELTDNVRRYCIK